MRIQVTIQIRFLGQVSDAGFGGDMARRMPEDFNVALGRIQQSQEQFNRGRFAGPIWAEQSKHFTSFHFKIDIVNGPCFRPVPKIFEYFCETTNGDDDFSVLIIANG